MIKNGMLRGKINKAGSFHNQNPLPTFVVQQRLETNAKIKATVTIQEKIKLIPVSPTYSGGLIVFKIAVNNSSRLKRPLTIQIKDSSTFFVVCIIC